MFLGKYKESCYHRTKLKFLKRCCSNIRAISLTVSITEILLSQEIHTCWPLPTIIYPSGRGKKRLLKTKQTKKGSNQPESLSVSHTYLQRHIWIHSEFGDVIGPRQEFLSFVVQIIIKDCSLGWKLHCFHLFMPPPTEFSLTTRKLRRTREVLITDLKIILNTHKPPPNLAEHTVLQCRVIITNGIE